MLQYIQFKKSNKSQEFKYQNFRFDKEDLHGESGEMGGTILLLVLGTCLFTGFCNYRESVEYWSDLPVLLQYSKSISSELLHTATSHLGSTIC
jgi:hypothetical protein